MTSDTEALDRQLVELEAKAGLVRIQQGVPLEPLQLRKTAASFLCIAASLPPRRGTPTPGMRDLYRRARRERRDTLMWFAGTEFEILLTRLQAGWPLAGPDLRRAAATLLAVASLLEARALKGFRTRGTPRLQGTLPTSRAHEATVAEWHLDCACRGDGCAESLAEAARFRRWPDCGLCWTADAWGTACGHWNDYREDLKRWVSEDLATLRERLSD